MAEAAVSGAARRRRRWWQLRRRWSMLGVFEIAADHEFFRLTTFIKEGARASLQKGLSSAPPETLTDEDYGAVDTQTHQAFSLQTMAGPVFRFLRRSVDVSEEQFLSSLCSEQHYLQFISNSKSRADFFLTHDRRFFLKTQSHREIKFLLRKLKAYVSHLDKYPHSLLVRFLGVYRIVIPNEMKKYFIVMQSVFFPDERIDLRFDIKGCEVGRWTDPDTGGRQVIKILKDNNFEGQRISLGPERSWFLEQVGADSEFLQSLNVLDYSLLLGHQPLHRDELQRQHSLSELVLRTTKSLDLEDGPDPDPDHSAPLLSRTGSLPPPDPGMTPDPRDACDLTSDPGALPLQDFGARHRRLLPTCENAVHVVDGPRRRHFVGIIDVFTVYGVKKRLENLWKTLRHRGRSFSTVSPRKYGPRFVHWLTDHTD